MPWPLLMRHAQEDMEDFANSIQTEQELIKGWYKIGKQWKADVDELKAHGPYDNPDMEAIRLKKIADKEGYLKQLREVIEMEIDNIKFWRSQMERIARGDFDG
jgi:hypothetical protein